jgi:D-alanyl-D-alanine carboxypeptidase
MTLLADAGVRSAIDLLSAWLEAQMAYASFPGVSVAIVHDQELVWAAGFGHADVERGRPATADTLYRIASITKVFTSTAILQLRDAGKLRLDDPLDVHLPWFRIGGTRAEAPPITIRHLLTHTGGLPREAGTPYWTDQDFPTVEEIRARVPQLTAALPTETTWKYSNLGLALAGEVVAAVSGQPYADYISEHILSPLGMKRTFVTTPPADHPDLALGYTRRLPSRPRVPAPFTDGRAISAAVNMTTCATDLARFAMLHFRDGGVGGAQILRGSTLREMQRVHWLDPDWTAGWGLGLRIARVTGRTLVGHGGSLRGYRTLFQLCPAERLGVIAMTNADDGNPTLVVDKAFYWVAPAIQKLFAPAPPGPAPVAWQRYTGKYRNAWRDVQVLVVDGRLAYLDPSQPDPMVLAAWLHPVGEHTFRVETRDGFGVNGELVVFELGDDGRVVRVKSGDNYLMPIKEW